MQVRISAPSPPVGDAPLLCAFTELRQREEMCRLSAHHRLRLTDSLLQVGRRISCPHTESVAEMCTPAGLLLRSSPSPASFEGFCPPAGGAPCCSPPAALPAAFIQLGGFHVGKWGAKKLAGALQRDVQLREVRGDVHRER